jgi:PAS domain S-box-containing protein
MTTLRVRTAKKWPLRFFVAVLIVCAGAYATAFVGKMLDASMRGDLLDMTRVVAASIDHNDVMMLSGTPTDLQTEEYEYLKIGMIRTQREVDRSRFAYLLGVRDGQVFIYVDSEPAESPDYSAPGDIYYEAPKAIAKNFALGESFAVGPYTDRWGTWISSYSPITDPTTGAVHAYFGLDISETAWLREVFFQQVLVVIATLFALTLFFVSMRLRDSRKDFLDLVRSEGERLKAIFEQLPVGILTASVSTSSFSFANKKALELLGHSHLEMDRRHTSEITEHHFQNLKGEPVPFEDLPLIKTLRTGVVVENFDASIERADKTRIIVHATSLPIFENGKIASALMSFEDVTKEKELERMKSDFVSMVSHQLRTPATAIRWLSEVLLEDRDKTLSKEQKEYLKQIHDGNQRMIALLMDLLDVSRVEAGKGLVMAMTPGNLSTVLDPILDELKPLANEKDIRIKKAPKFPKALSANFDSVKIKQVFQNLLENAVKYSNPGGNIVLDCDTSNSKEYIFSVKDEGVGIPLAQQSKIFERFFRASNAKLVANSGTGLGLYIAKVIVESHGGRIWFVSEENKGTTFLFSIPRT